MGNIVKRFARALLVFLTLLLPGADTWARGGGGCFLPNTPVLLTDGSSLAISKIKPGDRVQAYNSNGKLVKTQVKAVLTHQVQFYYVVSTPQVVLNVTGEHPFYLGNGLFKTVENLQGGDLIQAFDGNKLKQQPIVKIEKIYTPARVYNLQTEEPHTYFAAGIAVHNKGGGCFPAGTRVTTPEGAQTIESLSPGDRVIAVKQDGRQFVTRIKSTFTTRSTILDVLTDKGVLHTTKEHPVLLAQGGFREAGLLKSGDVIQFVDNNTIKPAKIKSIRTGEITTVFNLDVGSPHTFIADGYIVHNKGGGSGGRIGFSGGNDSPFSWAVFLVIVVIAIARQKAQDKELNLDFNYSRNNIIKKSLKTTKLIEFLARQDRTLDPKQLIQFTKQVFLKLQECWEAREYQPMQVYLMPDLYAQHLRQIEGMRRNHEVNRISNLLVHQIDLVNIRYPEKKTQREFTALITASAQDYYYDDETREFLRGDKTIETFQEFWTFQLQEQGWLLRDIEQTKESDYLKEENYVEMFTDGQIEKIYQGAVDQLGTAGPWLAREVESKANKVDRMLNFLVQSDKLWDRQAMLNRARQIFANVHLSLEAGELTLEIKSQLFPEVAEQFTATINVWKAEGNTIEYRNFCVRKVEILLVRNFDDKSRDEYTTRISAHAQRIQYRQNKVVKQDDDVRFFEEFWTFGRLQNEWRLKEVMLKSEGSRILSTENIDEGSSLDLVKWYYTKKRAM